MVFWSQPCAVGAPVGLTVGAADGLLVGLAVDLPLVQSMLPFESAAFSSVVPCTAPFTSTLWEYVGLPADQFSVFHLPLE